MNSIYVLTVEFEDDNFDMYFSTLEKAQNFIINNFGKDEPRKIMADYFEGHKNIYKINNWKVDQERL